MEDMQQSMELLKAFMDMIEKQFGSNCEVVLHDFGNGYEHTIVDIRNGHVTGRKIGGCATNLGLEIMKGTARQGHRFNYITFTQSGKILRSSSLHFTNSNGEMIGSLCINLDITDSTKFENYLREYNGNSMQPEHVDEFFVSDVQKLLSELIRQALQLSNKSVESMTREDKIQFIEFLDKKGAFFISKAGEKICKFLDISKYTFYTYLDIVRGETKKEKEK